MLSLGNKLSLNSTDSWSPISEGQRLQMFYEYKSLGPLDIPAVGVWNDGSPYNRDLEQATISSTPSYTGNTGEVTFDGSNDALTTNNPLTLDGEFTFAIKMNFADPISNDTLLASNNEANNFIKVINTDSLNMKFSSSSALINFNSSISSGSDIFFIITRDGDNVVSVNINGTTQTDTVTRGGSFIIDTLGVRSTNINDFAGAIYEAQVYSFQAPRLTRHIETRFNNI